RHRNSAGLPGHRRRRRRPDQRKPGGHRQQRRLRIRLLGKSSRDHRRPQAEGNPAVTAAGLLYVPTQGQVDIFSAASALSAISYGAATGPTDTSVTVNAEVDPNGAGNITECVFEYGEEEGEYNLGEIPCESGPALPYSAKTPVSAELTGLALGTT